MYQNYIFDLYGTLVDIRTNERKPSLWKYMAQYMTLQGAAYTPAELKKSCCALIDTVRREQHEAALIHYPEVTLPEIEPDLAAVFRRLYTAKGISPSEDMLSGWALMYRTISLDYVRLYDGAKELLEELRRRKRESISCRTRSACSRSRDCAPSESMICLTTFSFPPTSAI